MSEAKQSTEAPAPKPWVAPRWLLPAFAAAVVLLGCVAYWPQLDNGFTNWDDNWLITENRWIRSLDIEHVSTIFNPMAPQEIREELGNEYLPLRDLSYSINYALDGYNPRGYQATNLLFHIFNSLLVLLLAARLTGKPLLGGLAGLLFAIHPVHVEAVSWLSSRKDLLATFFVLLSLNFYLAARVPRSGLMASASFVQRARESKRLAWSLALLCFICALLSKMHAVVLPALLLLIELYRGRALALTSLVKRGLLLAPFWFVAALFTLLAMKIGQGLMREPYGDSLVATWLTATAALTRDIQVLVLAWPLQACVDFELRTGLTPYVAAGCALLVLTLGAGAAGLWFSWRDYSRRSSFLLAMLGFGALWFLIALSPVSNFFVQIGTVYADRYLYLPSVGFCFTVAAVASAAWERSQVARNAGPGSLARAALVVAIGAASIAGIWQTSRTTQNWRDSETLWISVLKQDEQNHTAHFNLGREYQERAMVETTAKNREHLLQLAEMEYRHALGFKAQTYRYDPARVYGALASIEIYRGAPAEALKLLDDAARHIDQPWRPARGKADIEAILGNYRGLALSALGRHEEALAEFRKALEKSNRYAGYRINLASEIARDALKEFPAAGSPAAGAKINEAALEQAKEEIKRYERERGRDSNSVEALALILKKEFDARLALSGKGGESTLPESLKPLLKLTQDAYKEAIALREKEVRNSKAMATLLLQAADAFLPGSPGDKTAESFLKRALSLDPDREGVRYLLARLLSERDDQASRIEATRMLNEELEKHPDFKPARSMRATGLLQQAVNELAALYSRFQGEFKTKRPDEGNPTWTQLTRDFVNREQYRAALDRGVALFVEAARWDSENMQLGEILNGGEPVLALDVGRGLWFFGGDSGRAQAELIMRTAFNLLPQDGPLTRFLTGIYLELAEKAVRTNDRAELLKLIENMLGLSKTARKLMSVQLINLALDIEKGKVVVYNSIEDSTSGEKNPLSDEEAPRVAAELMRTALLLDPESIPALNWLKLYYEKEGELDEAIVIYSKFEELLADKPDMLSGVRMAMAQCQFDLGQRCVKDYQKYLKLRDSDRAGRFAARAIEVLIDCVGTCDRELRQAGTPPSHLLRIKGLACQRLAYLDGGRARYWYSAAIATYERAPLDFSAELLGVRKKLAWFTEDPYARRNELKRAIAQAEQSGQEGADLDELRELLVTTENRIAENEANDLRKQGKLEDALARLAVGWMAPSPALWRLRAELHHELARRATVAKDYERFETYIVKAAQDYVRAHSDPEALIIGGELYFNERALAFAEPELYNQKARTALDKALVLIEDALVALAPDDAKRAGLQALGKRARQTLSRLHTLATDWFKRAQQSLHEGTFDKALEFIKRSIELEPENPEWWLLQANAQLALAKSARDAGNVRTADRLANEAAQSFQGVIGREPALLRHYMDAQFGSAECMLLQGKRKDALFWIDAAQRKLAKAVAAGAIKPDDVKEVQARIDRLRKQAQ